MADLAGAGIRELARYQVRPEALRQCLQATHEFVASADILYPNCLAPVEFIDYRHVASNLGPE